MKNIFKADGTLVGLSYSKSLISKKIEIPSRIFVSLTVNGKKSVKPFNIKTRSLADNYTSAVNELADYHQIPKGSSLYGEMINSLAAFIKKHDLHEEVITERKIQFESEGLDASENKDCADDAYKNFLVNDYGFPFGIYFHNKIASDTSTRPSVVCLSLTIDNKRVVKNFSANGSLEGAYSKAISALCELYTLPKEQYQTLLSTLPAFVAHYKIRQVESEHVNSYYRVTSAKERATAPENELS